MKKSTVYEDREEKERRRRERAEARMARHTVLCPHCGKEVLDHMTKCPHCGGELTPAGYRPMDAKKMKILKYVLYGVFIAAAVAVAVVIIVGRL